MPSTESAPAQRTPAWKRLGLKLKQTPASEPANGSSAVGHPSGSTGHKRKVEAPPSTDGSPVKRSRTEDTPNGISSSSKPKKSVQFGDTPSKNEGRSPPPTRTKSKPAKDAQQQQPKKPRGPPKKQTPPSTDIKPALEYLRLWKNSRESWKFNKNHQSALIRNIFEPSIFPASDVDTFYEYIRDLKGLVRTRLRETAMEVQMQDVADGTAGFPADTMDLDEKQEVYDSILADILRRKRLQQGGPKRKYFSEAQYVAESQDGDVIVRRVVKRMRAELVLEELSDSGEETENTTTTTSSKTVTASDNNTTMTTNGDKQPKLNETSGKRRRKLRVNMEDSSSSESESESGSEASSSSSSEEDSDSEDEAEDRPNEGYETSSSSSSSSSGEETESDEESDDED